ncbi:hypothetical protein WH52_07105 [Tenacibaculum holothuriorum]|uniref:Transglutaminase-like domain-containing protein n=1 Tax=Tenacibaculum holothuriorum TaxID=1635173 RepID=A0A1Y2PDG9_9FLAO|nr:transglutaminase domain-containing protein [Tenacibaculum holothuriorum]OSY88512.1 hypothetical protein WH52_07105 [Tenacibaculum holothuriorum]
MKQLLFLFIFFSLSVFSQNFSDIETKVNSYPKLISAEQLAQRIAKDFSTKENQVKTTFYWLTQNIRYDLESYYNPKNKRIGFRYRNEEERKQKLQAIKDNIVKETLQTRKAVCEGYAQSLAKICNLLDIENDVIKGYIRNSSRDINKPSRSTNHAWNAVKLNGKWIYIDPTWSAGAVMNGRWQRKFNPYYYDIPLKNYFKTHYPEDNLWQLRVERLEIEDYFNQPIYSSSFLNSTVELVKPLKGILTSKNNTIEIQLKNLKSTDRVMCGFLGSQYAQKPTITKSGTITTVRISPPPRAKELFLIINREVVLEFLIE